MEAFPPIDHQTHSNAHVRNTEANLNLQLTKSVFTYPGKFFRWYFHSTVVPKLNTSDTNWLIYEMGSSVVDCSTTSMAPAWSHGDHLDRKKVVGEDGKEIMVEVPVEEGSLDWQAEIKIWK